MSASHEVLKNGIRYRIPALSAFGGDELRRFLSGTGAILGIRIGGAGLVYLSQIALARWMGGYQYGIFAYAWSWIMMLGFLAPCGLNVSLMRNIPGYLANNRLGRLAGHLRWAPGMVLLTSSGMAALLTGLAYLFQNHLSEGQFMPLVLAAACLPAFAMLVLFEAVGRGFGLPVIAYMPAYLLRPVFFIAAMGAVVVMASSLNAPLAMLMMLAASLLALLVQLLLVYRNLPVSLAGRRRRFHGGAWIAAALPFMVIEAGNLVLSNADILMLGYFAPPEQTGQYFAAARTCSLLGYIPFAVAGIALPRFAEFHSTGDRRGLQRFVQGLVRWSFLPTLGGAVLLGLCGRPVLSVFGLEFTSAYPAMLVMLAGIVVRASTGPVEYLLAMSGYQRTSIAITSAAATLNVALNLLLIPKLGMVGAALATTISVGCSVTIAAIIARRRLGVHSFIVGQNR